MEDKDYLKQSIDLTEFAQKYTPLKGTKSTKRGPCPKCGGTDRFVVRRDNFYCNQCKVGGDIFSLLEWLENMTFKEALTHLSPTNGHHPPAAKLKATLNHGNPLGEWLYNAGRLKKIKFAASDGSKQFRWKHLNGGGWEWGRNGARPDLYNEAALAGAEVVYYTEGEKDADTLTRLGFVAISKPETGSSITDYAHLLADKTVYVLTDNDEAGAERGRTDAPILTEAGARVKVITPQIGGWDFAPKADVTDLVEQLRKGPPLMADRLIADILRSKVEAAPWFEPEPRPRVFQPLSLPELFQRPPKPWLWPELIGSGDLVMIFGEAGTAKSFSVLDLIVSGSLGLPFAGKFQPVRPLKIAYCAGEGLAGLRGRFMAALNRHGAGVEAPGIQVFLNVPQLFDEASEEHVNRFVSELSDQELDVVVIDTLHAAITGADENFSKDMGVILKAAKQISKELKVTVILIHHANKTGGYRGSSALHGAMDSMIQTKAEGDLFTFECFKQKDAERFQKMFFRLMPETNSGSAWVDWLEAVTTDLNRENDALAKARFEVKAILESVDRRLDQSEICDMSQVGRNNMLKALASMERSGEVRASKIGRQKLYELVQSV